MKRSEESATQGDEAVRVPLPAKLKRFKKGSA